MVTTALPVIFACGAVTLHNVAVLVSAYNSVRPSYSRRHIYGGAVADTIGVKVRGTITIDNIVRTGCGECKQ